MFLGLAVGACVIVLLAWRRWQQLNTNDLGTMSERWLAEYNAQHPLG